MELNYGAQGKVKIYINIEPLGLKIGTLFQKNESFQSVINFVLNQTKKLNIKFRIGRINEDKTNAILLKENIIGDFLQDNDAITVYSEDYGFNSFNLPGDNEYTSSKRIFYHKNVSDLYFYLKKKKNRSNDKKNNISSVNDKGNQKMKNNPKIVNKDENKKVNINKKENNITKKSKEKEKEKEKDIEEENSNSQNEEEDIEKSNKSNNKSNDNESKEKKRTLSDESSSES